MSPNFFGRIFIGELGGFYAYCMGREPENTCFFFWNFNKTRRISTKTQKCIHRHIFLVCGRCIPVPQTVFNNNLTFSHDAFIHLHFWLLASIGGIGTMPIIWLLQEATVYVHFCCKAPLELFPINEVFGSQPGDFVLFLCCCLYLICSSTKKSAGTSHDPTTKVSYGKEIPLLVGEIFSFGQI